MLTLKPIFQAFAGLHIFTSEHCVTFDGHMQTVCQG